MPEKYIEAAGVVPSERQLNWQKTELYAFCHFGMNTFTDKEWGDGTDSPGLSGCCRSRRSGRSSWHGSY